MVEPDDRSIGGARNCEPHGALPSCGETGDELGDLYADVDACRRAIAAAERPVILCGHSYSGMVITEAGADDRVAQLLYVTSVMPQAGQSQAELISAEPAPWMIPGDDGTVGVDPDLIRQFFLQDCDEATTEQALARLTRQSLVPFTQPPSHVAWQEKPATYFVCTEDLATPADVQRQRVKDSVRIVEFAAGHHPFLSRPVAFAQSIATEIARGRLIGRIAARPGPRLGPRSVGGGVASRGLSGCGSWSLGGSELGRVAFMRAGEEGREVGRVAEAELERGAHDRAVGMREQPRGLEREPLAIIC